MRAYREKRREELNAAERRRYASQPAEFMAKKRERERAYYRRTAEQTAERRRAENRAYYRKNPTPWLLAAGRRKARVANTISDLTDEQWGAIVESFDSRCAYCLRKLERPEIEHIEPVSKGGALTAENVVPACLRCNRRKNNRPIWSMVNEPLAPEETR